MIAASVHNRQHEVARGRDVRTGCSTQTAKRTRNYGVFRGRGVMRRLSRQLIVYALESNSVSVFVQSDYGESSVY